MNSQRNLSFIVLSICLVIIDEISAERRTVRIDDKKTSPLVLLKKADNSLSFAIPEKYYQWREEISYFYDDSEEELETACPIPKDEMTKEQKKWLEEETISIDSDVLSIERANGEIKMDCGVDAIPSIRQTATKCGLSEQGKFYEFGYPISIPDVPGITFLFLHKLCYSPDKGKIFSIHHIESSNIQLKMAVKYIYFSHLVYYTTKLDDELENKMKSRQKGYNLPDFVGFDLPIYQWYRTNEFLLNYTPITKNDELLAGMTKFDNFIRLISMRMQIKLTLYTGAYEYLLPDINPPQGENGEEQPVSVKLFWKIIMDPEKRTVIMVTQHAPKECYHKQSICLADSLLLDTYNHYGCTYLCPVNNEMLQLLDLPPMEISGYLELQFQKTSSQEFVHISSFAGNEKTFLSALKAADSRLFQEVINLQ